MRLPAFDYAAPQDLNEALQLLARHAPDAALLAGGTDLIPRMRKRLIHPGLVISLKNLKELDYIRQEEEELRIGSMTPLASILDSECVKDRFPALHQATKLIGAPPIQHFRGTIGGNLCLQTRCLFYNQSAFWRSSRAPCHKDHGEICYAEENSDRCRSANQSDGACALMALDAGVRLSSVRGHRMVPIEEFFTGKGEAPFSLEEDELVTQVRLVLPRRREGNSFKKLTYRSAIDFALVSAAALVAINEREIVHVRIAVGGAGASPLILREAAQDLIGKDPMDDGAVERVADRAVKHASAFMVDNLGSTLDYRQKMSGVMVKRALREALERALKKKHLNL